jgi:hypothetical protein
LNVIKQRYDSPGVAALATLLRFSFGENVTSQVWPTSSTAD